MLNKQYKVDNKNQEQRDENEEIKVNYKEFRTILEKQRQDKDKKQFNRQIFWKMTQYTRKNKCISLLSTFFMLTSVLLQTLLPKQVEYILDVTQKVKSSNDPQFIKTQIRFMIIIILYCITLFFRRYLNSKLSEIVAMKMRQDIYSKFMECDLQFFDNKKTGDLISRLGSDISTIQKASSGNISILIRAMLMYLFTFLILFESNWKLTFILISIVPFYTILTVFFGRVNRKLAIKYQDQIAQSSIVAEECFGNIRTVKSFAAEEKECLFFGSKNNQVYITGRQMSMVESVYYTLTNIFDYLAMMVILWYGGSQVLNNKITVGQLTSFMLYCTFLQQNSSAVSFSINNILVAIGVAQNLFKYSEYQSKVKDSQDCKDIDHTQQLTIEFRQVGFAYPSRESIQVLTDVTCKISQGEVIALVGHSGEGKSTIVAILQRFYDVKYGSILINNIDIKEIRLSSLHSIIGFVSQEPVLFSGTIEQNIVYGVSSYTQKWLYECCRQSNCLDFILDPSQFPEGFNTIVGERGIKLSGGQKQRISIARALIKKPKVLIFDEATSALDSHSEALVQDSINAIIAQAQITIIIIAHRLSTIINSNRIIVISKGQIVEEGDHNTLINQNQLYKQLINKQIQNSNKLNL